MHEETPRKHYDILRAQLELERASFLPHWRQLSSFILPRRARFTVSDVNRGDRRSSDIVDSTATYAADILRAGMMSGITSPARPWFRLSTPDPQMGEYEPVKAWLYGVSQMMATVFMRSNLYNALPIVYGDMGVFGTASMFVEEDFENVIRFYPLPIGSYCLSQNDKLQVDTLHREFRMTVRQVVSKFAKRDGNKIEWSNISDHVRSAWDSGHRESWVDICHVIHPNSDYDGKRLESKYKKFKSCYYEKGSHSNGTGGYLADKLLRESGYNYFPCLSPRWEVTGEDSYGTNCPGMKALGDVRQLQMGERRAAQAIEKMVNPPMVAPVSLRNARTSILPGDTTYEDTREGQRGFRPAHEVNPRLAELEAKQEACRERIKRCFYSDIFLQITDMDRRQVTATEIEERKAEKLVVLGPVLEQLNQDLLDPLIDITFDFMNAQNLIPPAPDELQGMPLKVEYISIMAQAQKLAGVANHERFFSFVERAAAVNPQVFDKVDMDQWIDVEADALSLPPGVVRDDDTVAQIRQARAEQERADQQVMQAKEASAAAKNLATSPTDQSSLLTDLLGVTQGAP